MTLSETGLVLVQQVNGQKRGRGGVAAGLSGESKDWDCDAGGQAGVRREAGQTKERGFPGAGSSACEERAMVCDGVAGRRVSAAERGRERRRERGGEREREERRSESREREKVRLDSV